MAMGQIPRSTERILVHAYFQSVFVIIAETKIGMKLKTAVITETKNCILKRTGTKTELDRTE